MEVGARSETAPVLAGKVSAYAELTKPRITMLILLVAVAGFWMASSGAPDAGLMARMTAGVALLAGGIFALNQYMERGLDALMRRTESRPLPEGRLLPAEALRFGLASTALAIVWLALAVNWLTGALAVVTAAGYLFLYTPLKTRTPHSTLAGAFPGAMPPLLGWAAVRGELSVEAWTLFAILFLWQFPHFHSIAWLYRDDYARAGVRMWPVVEPGGRMMGRQIVAFTILLMPVSLLPWALGSSGQAYLWGAGILGLAFLYCAFRMAFLRSTWQAQRLLLASVLYLPGLLMLMVLDKR